MSEFKLHPKYDIIPHPNRDDYLIIEFALEQGVNKEEVLDISVVRRSLCAINISDTVTARGKFFEEFACVNLMSSDHRSMYKFPRKPPRSISAISISSFETSTQ